MILLVAVLLAQAQDPDVASWIAKLGDDSIEVRDEAVRRLIGKGPAILDQLQRSKKSSKDRNLQNQLEGVITAITKGAELAKVFGTTYRLTTDSKPRLLKSLLETLGKEGRVALSADDIDLNLSVQIELKNATWWEALDQVAEAAGIKYRFHRTKKVGLELKVIPGRSTRLPVIYLEQFRIAVLETKRVKFEAPGRSHDFAQVIVEIRHQPNLIPWDKRIDFEIKSAVDSKGEDVQVEDHRLLGDSLLGHGVLGYTGDVWLRPDAAYPVTISGSASMDFGTEVKDVTLDLPEGRAEFGDASLRIEKFERTETEYKVTLAASDGGDNPKSNRLVDATATILGAEGKKATTWGFGMHLGRGSSSWEFKFPLDVPEPTKLTFRWVTGLHRVTIPIRLEGVRLP